MELVPLVADQHARMLHAIPVIILMVDIIHVKHRLHVQLQIVQHVAFQQVFAVNVNQDTILTPQTINVLLALVFQLHKEELVQPVHRHRIVQQQLALVVNSFPKQINLA